MRTRFDVFDKANILERLSKSQFSVLTVFDVIYLGPFLSTDGPMGNIHDHTRRHERFADALDLHLRYKEFHTSLLINKVLLIVRTALAWYPSGVAEAAVRHCSTVPCRNTVP